MTGYRIDAEVVDGAEILSVILPGTASFETITGLLRELDARRPLRVLVDQSGLRPGMVSPTQVREIAEMWKGAVALRSARIAAIAPSLVIYGLDRMFQALANSEDRFAVFKDRAEAIAWLLQPEPAR